MSDRTEKLTEHDRKKESRRHVRDKIFIQRTSILTDMMNIPHIKSIYNFFIAVLVILFQNKIIQDLFMNGRTSLGSDFVAAAFGRFHIVLIIWTLMQIAALFPFLLLKIWVYTRNEIKSLHAPWDISFLCIFALFQIQFLYFPTRIVCKYDLPIVSSFVILLEMVRFVMKNHAFIRTTTPNILAPNSKTVCPKFSSYIYFYFAPTLVYRDEYPRNERIDWYVAVKGFLEIVACTFCVSLLCMNFIIYPWQDFGLKVMPMSQFIKIIFDSMLPSFMMNLCGFYLLLHAWHNSTAEILRFADRQFYSDWWNQSDFSSYYRTWNIIVHDWLHAYVYKDVISLTGSKLTATMAVFMISALFHEFIISFAFRFFIPVMIFVFGGIGVAVIFITKYLDRTAGNIFVWFALIFGDGVVWSFYAIEYFSRVNCADRGGSNSIVGYLIPRFFSCHQIEL